jgi:uncharacterized membrane protein
VSAGRGRGLTPAGAEARRAAVLGIATGPRTFLAPAALALRGRLGDGRLGKAAKVVLPALALGELVGDKLPMAPPRVEGPGLVGRVASGAFAGHVVGGSRGARAGSAFALAATYPSQLLRAQIVARAQIPDLACAVPEDLIATTLVTFATLPQHPAVDGPKTPDIDEFSAHQHGRCGGIVWTCARVAAAGAAGTGAVLSSEQWVEGLAGRRPGPIARGAVFAAVAAIAYEASSA